MTTFSSIDDIRPDNSSANRQTSRAASFAALNIHWDWKALLVLFTFQLIVHSSGSNEFATFANILSAIYLLVVLLFSAWTIARCDSNALWTPLFWIRVAGAVFLGVGGLTTNIANEETLRAMFAIIEFDALHQLKVMMVQTVGIAFTLLFSSFFLRLQVKSISSLETTYPVKPRTLTYAFWFLFVGIFLRYTVVLPVAFGLSPIVAGVVLTLANVYYVGLVLLAIYGAANRGRYFPLLFSLMAIDIFASLLTFSKRQVFLVLLLPSLGYLSRKFSAKKLTAVAIVMLVIFPFAQNLVEFGRAELNLISGNSLQGTFDQRLEILSRYTTDTAQQTNITERQTALLRLSYLDTDNFVIEQYDIGRPGNSYRNLFATFVPRFLWPNKPTITSTGIELYYAFTGQSGSSFGTTLWAEAYWNFGWLGVLLMSVPIALVFAIFSRISLNIMRRQDWLLMPVVIIGLLIGTRVDGFFVADIVGPGIIGFVFWKILTWSRRLTVHRSGQI